MAKQKKTIVVQKSMALDPPAVSPPIAQPHTLESLDHEDHDVETPVGHNLRLEL